jgi:hypothetical protein
MTRTRRFTILYSAARAGFGFTLLGPPSWASERWIGKDAERPVGVAMRGLAARDVANRGAPALVGLNGSDRP